MEPARPSKRPLGDSGALSGTSLPDLPNPRNPLNTNTQGKQEKHMETINGSLLEHLKSYLKFNNRRASQVLKVSHLELQVQTSLRGL